jgi:hypothetical protein
MDERDVFQNNTCLLSLFILFIPVNNIFLHLKVFIGKPCFIILLRHCFDELILVNLIKLTRRFHDFELLFSVFFFQNLNSLLICRVCILIIIGVFEKNSRKSKKNKVL